ncbi:uncharacterized protein B0I36DRAFT_360871 [Microdochium trichocladiopsis]|uniref:Uncharacterized protein n=1 Tax=Microdochium trichocladiopsis TaxID=1682393 RepID=A0A9P9BR33_9PEZI|nr:uncharacterized protein B0I36DRAFT_360871 [Microdochium trichocladiopsis]KAH7035518.1 hypothetical protein B0I36DRAFT_360871 [Microdochium trichocladiopsis]
MTRRLPWKRTSVGGGGGGTPVVGAARIADERSRVIGKSPATYRGSASGSTAKLGRDPDATQGSAGEEDDDDDRGDDCKIHTDEGEMEGIMTTAGGWRDSERNRRGAGMGLLDLDRAGSTSPPPEPVRESFMIDGLDHDDRWRMVEDEFLATAQQFTAHLHAAEYQRLKSASRSQNATTIRNISRPVVGRMTDLVRMKQERKARSERIRREKREMKKKKQKQSLALKRERGENRDENMNEDEDDSDDSAGDPYSNTSLFGMMERPQKTAALLGPPAATAATRSAAVAVESVAVPLRTSPRAPRIIEPTARPTFTSIPGLRRRTASTGDREVLKEVAVDDDNETTGSEEDLDGPPVRVRPQSGVQRAHDDHDHTARATKAQEVHPVAMSSASSHGKHAAGARTTPRASSPRKDSKQPTTVEVSSSTSGDDDDDDDDDILTRLKNRRASHKASRDRKSRPSTGSTYLDVG